MRHKAVTYRAYGKSNLSEYMYVLSRDKAVPAAADYCKAVYIIYDTPLLALQTSIISV